MWLVASVLKTSDLMENYVHKDCKEKDMNNKFGAFTIAG
jgi:hypothetical protein